VSSGNRETALSNSSLTILTSAKLLSLLTAVDTSLKTVLTATIEKS